MNGTLAHRRQSSDRLYLLDVFRGLAALIVLGFHLHTVFGGFEIFALGYLAVDFFFLLSGFVMERTYGSRFNAGLTTRQFFAARFMRLAPTMAVGATLGLLIALYFGARFSLVLGMYATTIAFIPYPVGHLFPLNRPTWSIFFELFANVCHAAFLWRLGSRVILVIAAISFAALAYWLANGDNNPGNEANDFLGGFPRVMAFYCLGMFLQRVNLPIPAIPQRGVAVAALLGAISFPLYAVHYPMLQFASEVGFHPLAGAAFAILAAFAVVAASHLLRTRLIRS